MFEMKIKLLCILLLLPSLLFAEPFKFSFENDFFAPGGEDKWVSNITTITSGRWTLGTEMYTPRDKRSFNIPVGDRPWDGYTYIERSLGSEISAEDFQKREWKVRLGATGEASGAGELQKFIHNDLGMGAPPNGWHTANHSEPALEVLYQRSMHADIHTLIGFGESVAYYGFRAGNVITSATIGSELSRGFEHFYLLTGLEGSLVLYNTFLQGRLFYSDTYTVEKEPFVANAKIGVGTRLGDWKLEYVYKYLTEEFEGQDGRHLYGSVNIERAF